MCNIAGYAGMAQAAPILIEMLRKQQYYDGGMCTGIATVYQGKILWRKVVGDVDTLLRTTDALYLPGTVGIAHSRPGGTPQMYGFAHPYVSGAEDMALVANGTARGLMDAELVQALTAEMEDEGYTYRSASYVKHGTPRAKDGAYIANGELRLHLVDRHCRNGKTFTEAMALTASQFYKDAVMAAVSVREPDKIAAVRTTRPLVSYTDESGTYIATTCFAFEDGVMDKATQLPLMQACEITKDGVKFCEKMTGCEEVAEVTEYTLEEGYNRIVKLLEGKADAPLYLDDLEHAVWYDMRDLFPGDHTLIQNARLVYDVIYRLHREGRLKSEVRTRENGGRRLFFWI